MSSSSALRTSSSIAGRPIHVAEPGQKLREIRERLCLGFREVSEASASIARQRGSKHYVVGLSRLADIENKGTLPSIYRTYSLCAIYGLDLATVLGWYGIRLDHLAQDSTQIKRRRTQLFELKSVDTEVELPISPAPTADMRRTCFFSRQMERWGKLPAELVNALDLRNHRYGFIGTEDWSMFPILPPGSFIQVDESKRRVSAQVWETEYERPIFFLEHRNGYSCGWCSVADASLALQFHPSSRVSPRFFKFPGEVDVIGQVVGVAMRLDQVRRRHARS